MKKYLNERSMCIHNKKWTTPKEWFTLYTKFQSLEPRLVHICNFNKKELSFDMEDIDGFLLSDIDKMRELSIFELRIIKSEVIKIWGTLQTFSVDDIYTFIHNDYHMGNLMYDTKKNQVRLIDPDSFHKIENGHWSWHGPFIDTLYNTMQWERL